MCVCAFFKLKTVKSEYESMQNGNFKKLSFSHWTKFKYVYCNYIKPLKKHHLYCEKLLQWEICPDIWFLSMKAIV